jgi:ribosome-binding factor A
VESTSAGLCYGLDPYRHERVSEGIREELDELISYEMSDPRVGSATVTEVLISHDYRKAVIRLALIGTAKEQANTVIALNHAKAFLRRELTERLQLFKTPELHFEAALAADLAAKATKILKRIERGRPKSDAASPEKKQAEKNPIS